MSRMKFILLGLLAAFAVSAVASASASAATHNFKIEGKTVGTGEKEELIVQSKAGLFESAIAGTKTTITCQEDIGGVSTIEEKGKSKFELKFKNGCLFWEVKEGKKAVLTACKVKEPILAKGEDELSGGTGNPVEEFKEKGTEAFTTIEIEGGSCAFAKKFEVKGSTTCALPEAAVEEATHEIICTGVGSNLKFGGEAAYLYTTEWLNLKSLKGFSSE